MSWSRLYQQDNITRNLAKLLHQYLVVACHTPDERSLYLNQIIEMSFGPGAVHEAIKIAARSAVEIEKKIKLIQIELAVTPMEYDFNNNFYSGRYAELIIKMRMLESMYQRNKEAESSLETVSSKILKPKIDHTSGKLALLNYIR
ncbi:MAG TPA: hypothetical protein VL360_00950 [Gammaproteobacteria bacterium]|jgi:hypothetical protein|nr:hypothetical protein [Gammaproteobacteria bacterium]